MRPRRGNRGPGLSSPPLPRSEACFYVGPSAVHGKGVFALTSFAKHTRIGTFEGKRTSRDGVHVLWVHAADDTVYGILGTNELRFLNHESSPNAEFEGDALWSLRRIRRDEEITIHYGPAWDEVG